MADVNWDSAPLQGRSTYGEASGMAGIFHGDDLTGEVAEAYRADKPELTLSKAIQFDTSQSYGMRTVRARMYDSSGAAKWDQGPAAQGNTVDVGSSPNEVPYESFSVWMQWDGAEMEAMRAARSKGVRMPELYGELTTAANRALAEFGNDVGWFGKGPVDGATPRQMLGLVDSSIIESTKADYTVDLSGPIPTSSATAEQLANQTLGIIAEIFRESKKVHRPNFMLLPVAYYSYLAMTPMYEKSGELTILAFIENAAQRLAPGIKIDASPELDSFARGGNTINGEILCGVNSRTVARIFQSAPRYGKVINPDGLDDYRQKVACKTSGVQIMKPKAFRRLSNVLST